MHRKCVRQESLSGRSIVKSPTEMKLFFISSLQARRRRPRETKPGSLRNSTPTAHASTFDVVMRPCVLPRFSLVLEMLKRLPVMQLSLRATSQSPYLSPAQKDTPHKKCVESARQCIYQSSNGNKAVRNIRNLIEKQNMKSKIYIEAHAREQRERC